MAWLDDRIWCHPKLCNVSKEARWGYVASIAYSSGFGTLGRLTEGQVVTLGVTAEERTELIENGLWIQDKNGTGHVRIRDWDIHNGKRDERRKADRERKRRERAKKKRPQDSPRTDNGQTTGQSGGCPHVEGSEVVTYEEKNDVREARGERAPRFGAEKASDNGQPQPIGDLLPWTSTS